MELAVRRRRLSDHPCRDLYRQLDHAPHRLQYRVGYERLGFHRDCAAGRCAGLIDVCRSPREAVVVGGPMPPRFTSSRGLPVLGEAAGLLTNSWPLGSAARGPACSSPKFRLTDQDVPGSISDFVLHVSRVQYRAAVHSLANSRHHYSMDVCRVPNNIGCSPSSTSLDRVIGHLTVDDNGNKKAIRFPGWRLRARRLSFEFSFEAGHANIRHRARQ